MSGSLGNIFAENIDTAKRVKRNNYYEENETPNNRVIYFLIILFTGFCLLFIRLFGVTIFEGQKYRKLSSGNRLRETGIMAFRGILYDRSNKVLVQNIPVFESADGRRYFEVKPASVSAELKEGVSREYVYGATFAHALGYLGEVSEEELKNNHSQRNLTAGDLIGKSGIEKYYDDVLAGKNGKELTEVDALGQKVRTLGRVEPIAGNNLRLSLDAPLSIAAAVQLKDQKGAVVASNPHTGEIYALYSSPSFDPNLITRGIEIDKIFSDDRQLFFNRAISGLYPPGSTFKIVSAIAGLETGKITKDTTFEDTGVITIGEFSFGNWYFSQYGKKEGLVDIVKALKRSNDIFFYKAAEATGIRNLAKWAKKVGIGSTLGIDIEGEEKGLMPDEQWQKKTKGTAWFLGDTYHVGIGQGELLVTPLQANFWTNLIANGGKRCTPHILAEGKVKCLDLGVKKENLELIRTGMKEACSPASPAGGPGGTGWPLFKFKVQSSKFKVDGVDFFDTYESTASGKQEVGIPVACKTGTSEFGDPQNRTHAWFTVFAPIFHPQISITVLVEGAGEGSNVAAPIAKKMLEEWFGR